MNFGASLYTTSQIPKNATPG